MTFLPTAIMTGLAFAILLLTVQTAQCVIESNWNRLAVKSFWLICVGAASALIHPVLFG